MNRISCLIIGAGWSGIGTAGSLAYHRFEDYVVLEQSDVFGGFWKDHTYDSVRMHDLSRLYKTPTNISQQYEGKFLTRNDVPSYLESYARHYDIHKHTRFGVKVVKIRQVNSEWVVDAINIKNDAQETYICQYLCIATSYCRVPLIPENIRNSMNKFKGPVVHSNDYKNPSTFDINKGKRIIIIGGGHSASEISTELADSGFEVTISHRSGQYFMKHEDWTPYLSNQNLDKSISTLKCSMADVGFNDLLKEYDNRFSNLIFDINDDVNWKAPAMKPASFIIFNKKTFIDDPRFFELLFNKSIQVMGTVAEIVENGVKLVGEDHIREFDGIVLCTGFRHGLEEFLEDSQQYISSYRFPNLPFPEKSPLPMTDGRCKSTVKENLYFPGFDYGINQRVDFALYSWRVGENILRQMGSDFKPELPQ